MTLRTPLETLLRRTAADFQQTEEFAREPLVRSRAAGLEVLDEILKAGTDGVVPAVFPRSQPCD